MNEIGEEVNEIEEEGNKIRMYPIYKWITIDTHLIHVYVYIWSDLHVFGVPYMWESGERNGREASIT